MYPLLIENGKEIRKIMQENKIFISTLWPSFLGDEYDTYLEEKLSQNILPIPCDQRYTIEDMKSITIQLKKIMIRFNWR